jgi:hypothetical protein
MSSISLGSPHASPFCLATTNISAYLGQMNAFTAKWVNTSTRTWSGNAYCVGSIVPNAAVVGSSQFTVANTTILRQHMGGAWGSNGASKNVSDDAFVALTSTCTWGFNTVTGSTTTIAARNRIVIARVS